MGYKRVDSYDNARDKVKHKIRFRLLPLHQERQKSNQDPITSVARHLTPQGQNPARYFFFGGYAGLVLKRS